MLWRRANEKNKGAKRTEDLQQLLTDGWIDCTKIAIGIWILGLTTTEARQLVVCTFAMKNNIEHRFNTKIKLTGPRAFPNTGKMYSIINNLPKKYLKNEYKYKKKVFKFQENRLQMFCTSQCLLKINVLQDNYEKFIWNKGVLQTVLDALTSYKKNKIRLIIRFLCL